MAHGFGIVGIPKRGGGPLVKHAPDAVIDRQHPLAQGLLSAWVMSASYGSTIADRAGTTQGVLNGGNLSPVGYTPGASGFIDLGTATRHHIQTFTTFARVFRTGSHISFSGVVHFGTSNSNENTRMIVGRSGGSAGGVSVYVYDTAWRSVALATDVALNQWSTVASIGKNGTLLGAVNGVMDAGSASYGTVNYSSHTGPAQIGRYVSDSYPGVIGDVYDYSRALNPTEIAQLHAQPYCFFWERRKTIFVPVGAAPPAATPRSFGYIIA